MRRLVAAALLMPLLWSSPAIAASDGRSEPVKPAADNHPLKQLWSGYHYASPKARSMQDSESDNPAMALYNKGEALWKKVEGKANKSCASCHGDAAKSMKGAATRFPAYFPLTKKPLGINSRINLCREKFMQARSFPPQSDSMLALAVYVKRQSRGQTIRLSPKGPLKPFVDKGKSYFTARRGQLDIACAQCHDKYTGKRYRSDVISQGHANGFPAYRMSWKQTGSLLRQVNQCLKRVRATPLKAGSDDLVNLELYLAWRAGGLQVETPAVRD